MISRLRFTIALPESVQVFKLLEDACLEQKDRQLVLTRLDYEKTDTLLQQMGSALKKLFEKQSLESEASSVPSVKVEPAFLAEEADEETYFTKSQYQRRR